MYKQSQIIKSLFCHLYLVWSEVLFNVISCH
jgi:hypothetical protein